MKLTHTEDENFEQWCERVRLYELNYARLCIAKGQDLNLVLEAMAARIQNKILHPILKELNKPFDKN